MKGTYSGAYSQSIHEQLKTQASAYNSNPAITIEGPQRYGAVSAKVSALRSEMLREGNYIDMASVKTVEGLVQLLLNTAYKPFLEPLLSSCNNLPACITKTVNARFSYLIQKLFPFFKGRDAAIYRQFVKRYDIMSAKVALAGKLRGKSFEEVEQSLIFGLLNVEDWKRMLSSERPFSSVAKGLGLDSKYAGIVESAKDKEAAFTRFVGELERSFYGAVKRGRLYESSLAFSYLMLQLDVSNVLLVARARKEGWSEAELREALHGSETGFLREEELIAAYKDESRLNRLLRPYGMDAGGEPVELYKAMQKTLSARKKKLYSMKYFSVDRTLMFFLLMEEEAKNIKKLVLAKELGLSKEAALSGLIM